MTHAELVAFAADVARPRKLPREQIITGCVRRFRLGGDAQDLRFSLLAEPNAVFSWGRR